VSEADERLPSHPVVTFRVVSAAAEQRSRIPRPSSAIDGVHRGEWRRPAGREQETDAERRRASGPRDRLP